VDGSLSPKKTTSPAYKGIGQ